MADWSSLAEYLRSSDDTVQLTLPELGRIVGRPLPPSASNHRAWWSGDRPHVRAWLSAGYEVFNLDMGRSVKFRRVGAEPAAPESDAPAVRRTTPAPRPPTSAGEPDLLLVACVKAKLERPAPAKDLYSSPLFRKERAYAEALGVPWFILSAEHGLVAPDEWLAPYSRYLPDTPTAYRAAWGGWVAARLELLAGPIRGMTVEIHAGSVYIAAARPHLEALGAEVIDPLQGLAMGERLAWYRDGEAALPEMLEAGPFVELLLKSNEAVDPETFLAGDRVGLDRPGLYSWWVDQQGAEDLSRGLGVEVSAGLIYAGLAGATRWPSGKRSASTLWSRVATMHLAGNHEFSTLRRTVAAIVFAADGSSQVDEAALSRWMQKHLRIVAVPYDDSDTLGQLERDVLEQLDPPLNLQGMAPTPARERLRDLRRAIS